MYSIWRDVYILYTEGKELSMKSSVSVSPTTVHVGSYFRSLNIVLQLTVSAALSISLSNTGNAPLLLRSKVINQITTV